MTILIIGLDDHILKAWGFIQFSFSVGKEVTKCALLPDFALKNMELISHSQIDIMFLLDIIS